MSLTRRLLKELELTDDAVERIIAAHADTVDALKQERDAALIRAQQTEASLQERDELRTLADTRLAEASAAREELDAYRTRTEARRQQEARRTALAEALAGLGANPQAIPLLLDAVKLPEECWAGDALADPSAALHPVRTQYGAFFTARSPIPVTQVRPPVSAGGLLTHEDIRRMSEGDINRNWSAVSTALTRN